MAGGQKKKERKNLSNTITIQYSLTEKEKETILKDGVGADSRSANRTIAKALIEALEEGVTLPEGRESFAPQQIKKKVSEKIANNPRCHRARKEMASNYVHYRITCAIHMLRLYREHDILL